MIRLMLSKFQNSNLNFNNKNAPLKQQSSYKQLWPDEIIVYFQTSTSAFLPSKMVYYQHSLFFSITQRPHITIAEFKIKNMRLSMNN